MDRISVEVSIESIWLAIADWPGATEASERLGITRQAINQALRNGQLRGIKTQIGWIIDPRSIHTFAARQRHEDRS